MLFREIGSAFNLLSVAEQQLALKAEDRRVLVGRLSALELPTGRQSAPAIGKELSLTRQH